VRLKHRSALISQYDLSGVKSSKKDKYHGDSPSTSSTGVAMAEAGASEKETKQLDQRGAPIGGSAHGPMGSAGSVHGAMGAGPQHPSGDETDAGHQAWERERNLMRYVLLRVGMLTRVSHVPSSAEKGSA